VALRDEDNVGVDVISGPTHTAVGTAANVSDVAMAGQLLRSDDKMVFAYAGYTGAAKRPENEGKDVDWQVARKRGQVKKLPEGEVKGLTQYAERLKASVRARVEHPFTSSRISLSIGKPAIAALLRTKANGGFCSLWPTYT
jgi:IS5 family transposase